MSIQHFALFWAHSESTGAARLVGVELAQRMNTSTGLAWPSVHLIAQGARVSRRSVTSALAELIALGEIEEAGEVRGQRAWRMLLACPADCDGSAQHRTMRAVAEREAARARERERRAARRAAVTGSAAPPAVTVEAAVRNLSAQNLRGQVAVEGGVSAQNLRGHEGVVRANPARLSAQNLRGQGPVSLYREPKEEPPPQGARRGFYVVGGSETEADPDGPAGGGNRLVDEVRESLPLTARRSLTRAALARALAGPAARGLDGTQVAAAVRRRSWDGTGPGAVIAFLRDLTLEDVATDAEAQSRRVMCDRHPDVEITRTECRACAAERVERAAASGARRREGETREQWLSRVGDQR